MKKSVYRKLAGLCVSALILSLALCGCSGEEENPSDDEESSNMENIRPSITLVDDQNSDKVMTEKPFETPAFKGNENIFTLSAIYSDHMVLQANMNCRIFGKYAGEGNQVAACLEQVSTGEKRTFYGAVDDAGEFEIWLGATGYGGPYTLTLFNAAGNSLVFQDVLFGEVYVLGGQSNMGWALSQCYDGTTAQNRYQDIIDASANDQVRSMLVFPAQSDTPVAYLENCRRWAAAAPGTVPGWSAVGYFFAARLNEIYQVPVGVISACMGGIPIGEWRRSGSWYNGTVAPLHKMTVRGVCWYQGEGDCNGYADRLAALIAEWREDFGNPGLYWASVQLPRYINETAWAQSREEVKSLKAVVDRYTYCVTLDTGLFPEFKAEGDTLNDDGIHPYDKLAVGTRLADAAAKDFYGAEGLWSSPVFQSAVFADGKVTVTFDNVGEGLCLQGLAGFEVAGRGENYYDAAPVLTGKNTVVLVCDQVPSPRYIRYGYKNRRGEGITSCAQSVCVYNTKDGSTPAYPAEQFAGRIQNG